MPAGLAQQNSFVVHSSPNTRRHTHGHAHTQRTQHKHTQSPGNTSSCRSLAQEVNQHPLWAHTQTLRYSGYRASCLDSKTSVGAEQASYVISQAPLFPYVPIYTCGRRYVQEPIGHRSRLSIMYVTTPISTRQMYTSDVHAHFLHFIIL